MWRENTGLQSIFKHAEVYVYLYLKGARWDGKEGIQRSVKAIIRQLNNNHDLLHADFSTLYLHIALDYVLFRHASLLSAEEHDILTTALHNSPFKDTLAKLSLESLSKKLNYCEYKNSWSLWIVLCWTSLKRPRTREALFYLSSNERVASNLRW